MRHPLWAIVPRFAMWRPLQVAAWCSSHCRSPLSRCSCTPHSVVAIASRSPLLLSSWAFCSTVVSVAPFVALPPFDFCPMFIKLSSTFRPTFVQLPSTFHPSDARPTFIRLLSGFIRPSLYVHWLSSIAVHPHWRIVFFKPYVVSELCSYCFVLLQNFGAWDHTMSSDDENTTTQLEPRYQLQSNT